MARMVLQLRMEALAHHLEEAKDPDSWIGLLRLENKPDKNLWLMAVDRIQREADDQLATLKEALDGLNDQTYEVHEAWNVYLRVQRSSEEIFRECVELIGGLALRDRIDEEYICRFADELIKECAAVVGKLSSFAIPAFEDTLSSSTLRRVARVRFPDYHLWTLPLVAYEYGNVIVRETNLRRLTKELADEWSKSALADLINTLDDQLGLIDNEAIRTMAAEYLKTARQGPQRADDDFKKIANLLQAAGETKTAMLAQAAAGSIQECWTLAERRAQVLLADAFATFTTGPAYAFAALILRLNPKSAEVPGRPTDEQRAAMILAILHAMDASAPEPPPFADIIKALGSSWQSVLTGPDEQPVVSASPEAPIDAGWVLTRFKAVVVKPDQAAYSRQDWTDAKKWAGSWYQDLESGETDLELPHEVEGRRLRDALNAAWLCRQMMIDKAPSIITSAEGFNKAIESIAEAARYLCDAITAERAAAEAPSNFGGPAPRP